MQKDVEVAERVAEAFRRHAQAIDAMKKDAAGSSAPGSSQDHLRMQRHTPKINSMEEARQILVDLGWTRAVKQQEDEQAEVHDRMATTSHNNWYQPGLIWKRIKAEGRDRLNEQEEIKTRHYEVENEYWTEKHLIVETRISSEILELAYRKLKERH